MADANQSLAQLRKKLLSTVPVIDGTSLAIVLDSEATREQFVLLAMQCPAVVRIHLASLLLPVQSLLWSYAGVEQVCCRCSPTQKAQVVSHSVHGISMSACACRLWN